MMASGPNALFRRLQIRLEWLSQIEQWQNPQGYRAVIAIATVTVLIGLCSGIVYWTGGTTFVWVHLMYLPIILAAASFGISGGILAALLAGLAVGPYMPLFISSGQLPEFALQDTKNWLSRTFFFLTHGALIGFLFHCLQDRLHQLKESHLQLHLSHEELKNTQLLLIQEAKLESVGRLAAGVAHEVKNPLAVIQLGADYLNHELAGKGNEELCETIRDITDAVQRADRIIKDLLDFSRSETLPIESSDLNRAINDSLLLVKHELTLHHILLKVDLCEKIPLLKLDINKIKQVFINLFINAVQAMGDSGILSVSTEIRRLKPDDFPISSQETDIFLLGEDVVIAEVSDTGQGISPDKLDKVFDPFFTTKAVGVGTGLGLSISRKIIELHHAAINIRNRREGGAQVVVIFKIPKGDKA